MATNASRAHSLAITQWLITEKGLIGYGQVRPMATATIHEQDLANLFHAGKTINPDCSEITTMICRMSGYKDPNGSGYNGWGNTETLYANLRHVTDPSRAHTGTIVVFGVPELPQDKQHAAMVMTPGADPQLFSHGTTSGPKPIAFSVLRAALGSPSATFLDCSAL